MWRLASRPDRSLPIFTGQVVGLTLSRPGRCLKEKKSLLRRQFQPEFLTVQRSSWMTILTELTHYNVVHKGRVQLKRDGTRWRTGGEVKGKLVNGVGSQYSHTTSEHGVSGITTADAHTSVVSSRLNWSPSRFKWTSLFRRKMKSGFCACAITFQTQSNTDDVKSF
jgi:hypothetical protein